MNLKHVGYSRINPCNDISPKTDHREVKGSIIGLIV